MQNIVLALAAALSLAAVSCSSSDVASTPSAKPEASAPAPSASAASAAPSVVLKKGDAAPAFKLKGSDGKEHALADHAGKQAVVIAWFPKAFTGGCTAECKSLHENSEALKAFDAAIYAASVDTAEEDKKFAESLEVDYPILADPTKETAKAYGVLNDTGAYAQRWTFIIGSDGKILEVLKEVSPGSHGKDLAAKLAELGVAKRAGAEAAASGAPSAEASAAPSASAAAAKPAKAK
jgi:peroxiredoxin Q/BCP